MFLLSQVLKEGHLCLVLWSALKCSPIFFAVLWLNLTIFFPGSRSLCVLTSWIPLASAPAWKQQHLSAAAPDLWMESPGEHMGLLSMRDTG
jgi:hypothetical protein